MPRSTGAFEGLGRFSTVSSATRLLALHLNMVVGLGGPPVGLCLLPEHCGEIVGYEMAKTFAVVCEGPYNPEGPGGRV